MEVICLPACFILASRALCTRLLVFAGRWHRGHRGDVCKRLGESTGVIRNPGIPLAHDPGPMCLCIVCCVSHVLDRDTLHVICRYHP